MQELFNIKSSSDSYCVSIGKGIYKDLIRKIDKNYIIICDEFLLKKYQLDELSKNILSIKAIEDSKDLVNISSIISNLKDMSLKKGDLLIGIGGGIIQDITCFAASIYMRGVDWIYFPTTFLGICDSCIGGKSSINVNGIKNLVGNFYPPKEIHIDLAFLQSLPAQEIDSGLCEAIKICYASNDQKIFLECYDLVKSDTKNNLLEITKLSLKTKKWFIEKDEFDTKERQLLNFGHTFGHALEASCSYAIPHGLVVGFGMLWAINFSSILNKNFTQSSDTVLKLEELIKKIINPYKEFMAIIDKISVDTVFDKFVSDKKHQKNKYACILIDEKGDVYKRTFDKDLKFSEIFTESFQKLKQI